ncbi:MAG: 23S rRNA (adenine(2503)-C(2))-methyltransferase RlmN [Lachnospiraceae bacterium]|nr:23S rRNA (adenine(2503)-C(2))-methyltransferase RlmN [Lachnospiraceae bacterium]
MEKEEINSLPSPDVMSLFPEELAEICAAAGEKPYRAKQLFGWIHAQDAVSYEEMLNLPKSLRTYLAEHVPFVYPSVKARQESKLDGTVKFLFEYQDGALVESVLMKYKYGSSLCISTQVGCRMGCRFCASTLNGLERSLSAGEMLGEVYAAGRSEGVRISNVVLMGTGEPLDNYDEVVRFIKLLTHPDGKKLSGRNIAVSTCGLVPMIRRLAEEKLTIALALSLHAPNDEIRQRTMPVAKKWSIEETLDAMRYYAEQSGRRVTFEYALIKGVNDSDDNADELASRISGIPCLVNLIPVNPVAERGLSAPDDAGVARFKKRLEKYRINVTIRRELGRDIDGACGQLRRRFSS